MNKFKWHLLTAFLTLLVTEMFGDGFQPIALVVGSVVLGVCLFIGESFVNGVFNCQGISGSEDLVYPTIPGVVYVQWDTQSDGTLYISDLSGDPEACQRIRNIEDAKAAAGAFLTPVDIPKDIRVLRYPEDGIDPYAFLGIPRPK